MMHDIVANLIAAVALAQPCVTVHAPRAVLCVQVARTEAERERGLMGRRVIPPHTGMLFVFPADEPVTFWMKDTLVPLDMIFVAADGRVRSIIGDVHTVAPGTPDDAIPLEHGRARYVIELPAGEARADGIEPGVVLTDVPRAAAIATP
jgi:uncharacterized membrane protein (UPF0127 family)